MIINKEILPKNLRELLSDLKKDIDNLEKCMYGITYFFTPLNLKDEKASLNDKLLRFMALTGKISLIEQISIGNTDNAIMVKFREIIDNWNCFVDDFKIIHQLIDKACNEDVVQPYQKIIQTAICIENIYSLLYFLDERDYYQLIVLGLEYFNYELGCNLLFQMEQLDKKLMELISKDAVRRLLIELPNNNEIDILNRDYLPPYFWWRHWS